MNHLFSCLECKVYTSGHSLCGIHHNYRHFNPSEPRHQSLLWSHQVLFKPKICNLESSKCAIKNCFDDRLVPIKSHKTYLHIVLFRHEVCVWTDLTFNQDRTSGSLHPYIDFRVSAPIHRLHGLCTHNIDFRVSAPTHRLQGL